MNRPGPTLQMNHDKPEKLKCSVTGEEAANESWLMPPPDTSDPKHTTRRFRIHVFELGVERGMGVQFDVSCSGSEDAMVRIPIDDFQ